ncbi:MAG: tautomerase family protein [Betaproteobacteria bacterium]|nr:tautomerase family protein [Betaproteobacteria bacterium]
MPISHITLRRGHPDAYLDALSNSLHEALVDTFEVPENDRFQVFHELDLKALCFDRNYLAGPRSDNWVLIEITAGRPRSTTIKRSFYRCLAERLADSPGIAPADVMVVIRHNQAEDWSFGRGLTSMLEMENET